MRKNNDHYYSGITSFEDLHLEKTRLVLRSRLIQTKIKVDIIRTKEELSLSAVALSVARKFVPQDLYEIVEGIIKK